MFNSLADAFDLHEDGVFRKSLTKLAWGGYGCWADSQRSLREESEADTSVMSVKMIFSKAMAAISGNGYTSYEDSGPADEEPDEVSIMCLARHVAHSMAAVDWNDASYKNVFDEMKARLDLAWDMHLVRRLHFKVGITLEVVSQYITLCSVNRNIKAAESKSAEHDADVKKIYHTVLKLRADQNKSVGDVVNGLMIEIVKSQISCSSAVFQKAQDMQELMPEIAKDIL
eukprot:2915711-Pyramimonas_sp.AAC.1